MTTEQPASARGQELSLLHLRRLHARLALAKAKGRAWLVPLLLGGACGIVLFLLVAPGVALVAYYALGQKTPSAVPHLLGIVAAGVGWVLATRWFRARARRRSAAAASQAEAEVVAAADDVQQRFPQWVEQLGGRGVLLDAQRVADAIRSLRPPAVAPASVPPAGAGLAAADRPSEAVPGPFKHRASAAIYPLALVTAGVYFLVWIYKIHAELFRRLGPRRTVTPGLALGLMFIPVFNHVWLIIRLYKAARLANEIMAAASGGPRCSAGGILTLLIIGEVITAGGLIFGNIIGAAAAGLLAMPFLWIAIAKAQSALNRAWAAEGLTQW